MVCGSESGRSGSTVCTAAATLFVMEAGSPPVRTAMPADGHELCQKGTYMMGQSSSGRPPY
jgi:hypothetical protein